MDGLDAMPFALSTFALLLGPLVYAWGRQRPVLREILDGFVLITVAGITCVYIVPDAIAVGGIHVLAFLAAGLLFPVAIEKIFRRSLHRAHVFIVVLAALALIVHAVIDGIALLPEYADSTAAHGGNSPLDGLLPDRLALGVILHRLPVGMAIWWSVRPAFGATAAIATFALIVFATGLAFFFGAPVVAVAEASSIGYFQAFVAGSLVHVVAFGVSHDHGTDNGGTGVSWGFRVGLLLAMFLVFTLPRIH